MIWLPLLKRFGPALAVLVCIGVAYGAHRKAINTSYRTGYQAAEADMNARVIEANARTLERDAAARTRSQQQAEQWEATRGDLQSQLAAALGRRQPVRLCQQAAGDRAVPGEPSRAGSIDDSTERIESALRAGPDVGNALALYAATCEADRLKLLALQGWIKTEALAKR